MTRSTTYRYQLADGQKGEISIGDSYCIEIHFRFPDGAKLITLQSFGAPQLVPPEIAKDFLHWLAEI
jgi:hypothetical protein